MDINVQKKLEDFFSQYRPLQYKKGDIIVRPEDPIFGIYLLKKGFVKQYIVSEDGDEVTIHIFKPVSFFPMMLAIGNTENNYFFEAVDSVEVWRAPTDKALDFVKNEPEILFDLASRFAAGLNGLSKRIEVLMFENAYRRITSLLLYLSKRFGEKEKNNIIISLPLTHKDIAAWVNLTRETTSRQLEKLSKKNIISYQNHHFVIKNLKMLEEII